jgi:HK97 family phage major capsid protein
MEQIEGMLSKIAQNQIDAEIDTKLAKVVEKQESNLEITHNEMREIRNLLLEAHNRDSRTKPFKEISQDTKDFIDHVWKPQGAKQERGIFVEPAKMKEAIERVQQKTTSTISTEGTDTEGGYTVPEEFDRSVIRYAEENAIVWPRATIVPMRTDSKVIMKLDQTAQGTAAQIDDFAGIECNWTEPDPADLEADQARGL